MEIAKYFVGKFYTRKSTRANPIKRFTAVIYGFS
jgi:hypothetical protein